MTTNINEGDPVSAARYRAPALEKGLDILELLARQASGMSLTVMCREMGRSLGEIYRIALALEARGYIRREAESDSFALTLRLFELASEHPPMNRLLSAALPEMQRLAAEAEQSCHLAIVTGGQLLVIAQVDSPRPMHYAVRMGARFPVLETSSGAVFLAFGGQLDALEDAKRQSPDFAGDIEQRLKEIRRTGGERRQSLVVSGVINLSRPVFDHHGVVAVLTMPFLDQRGLAVGVDQAEAAIIASAQRLSAALGGRSSAPPLAKEVAA
ncbi:MAG: IclR family transcriptional regulator [Methylobacterium sp.]|jgi:DNA-binding IclR family transcriptional regulator|nr:IclR family transcriptional regulator [Methylobacterium sp.]MCA3601068.1 IclR family transcriptional regulator [Methylobacterium sp.]MCA3603201.1 IclR family transcriptional regulator [Methylobacterium sp.]MCA3615553.1 IclR family transcriptional regulator [Methylobacterium sp.]MCA3640817.1 IclR family transcriptional regulator [Methylobacterium sp.]